MASSQVNPGTPEGIDMSMTSFVGYSDEDEALPLTAKDTETQKNMSPGNQTLDEYIQEIENFKRYVKQNFQQKECVCFVPKPGQTSGPRAVKKRIDLRCHCGEVLREHQDTTKALPEELLGLMSKEKWDDAPPLNLPLVEWNRNKIKKCATSSFGKINFENVEHAGGKKPAKYIRMSDEDSVDNLLELMVEIWEIMTPKKPNLVISVVGGAKNFKLGGRMRDIFSTGLIKAAKTTNAWLISSGFNMGVMKSVGQAVRQGQSFSLKYDKMVRVLKCIGIASWGCVKDRKQLESKNGQGKFDVNYRTSNVVMHYSAVPLNPYHTHFIFVDDGYRDRPDSGETAVRSKLEQTLSNPEHDGGLNIPVVKVVVEGGVNCIYQVKSSLEHKIPVVVCAGTGRAADILAYAYRHTICSGIQRKMKGIHELKLKDKIFDAFGGNWKEEEIDSKTNKINEIVKCCCRSSNLVFVFDMKKHEDLDLAILTVLLESKSGADEVKSQLELSLTWDRSDIAQEEIFKEDVQWSNDNLNDILTKALESERVKFVELILQQGIVMKEYLTKETLQRLYEIIPQDNYICKILHKLTGSDKLTLENVGVILLDLLDKYDYNHELLDDKTSTFKRPYKMLLLWAVICRKHSLAKLFWKLGDEPITSALAASRMYHSLRKKLPIHETQLKNELKLYQKEFQDLATKVLDEGYHHDQTMAIKVIERKSPCWDELTCLQIAASAKNRIFLSAPSSQNSIRGTWENGITFPWYKVLLSIMCPPYIIHALEIREKEYGADHNQMASITMKMAHFYSSPISKFVCGSIMYVVFLMLHSYMVLVDFNPDHVTALEAIVVLWILTFFVDEVHTFLAVPSPTLKSKLRDWYGVLKWLEQINFMLVFVGFLLHLLSEMCMFFMVLFIFLLAYGVASQSLLYHQRSPHWDIIRYILYYPYWQLHGEIFLEDIETEDDCMAGAQDCRTYHWLVEILKAGYLLVGNVILLNLLIAIFSQVFHEVNRKAIGIWKYQMYFLVMEYEVKTAIVPPFSIFQHIVLMIRWIFRKTSSKHEEKVRDPSGTRHLEYLQLFEKEMMMNVLRKMKTDDMSSLQMTVGKLQNRVDDLTKLIEDEVIADQQFGKEPVDPNSTQPIEEHEKANRSSKRFSSKMERKPDVIKIKLRKQKRIKNRFDCESD